MPKKATPTPETYHLSLDAPAALRDEIEAERARMAAGPEPIRLSRSAFMALLLGEALTARGAGTPKSKKRDAL